MKIILLGYMGAGKSGVGEVLAENLHLPFRDLDLEIGKSEKSKVAEIFETRGEIYFRKKELQVLTDLLENENPFVLALGGGTPCYGKNLQLLKEKENTRLVYLKTSLETLRERIFKERMSRPLVSHLETEEALEDFIRKHLFERSFYYNQSEMIVETDNKSFEEIAQEIMAKLQ